MVRGRTAPVVRAQLRLLDSSQRWSRIATARGGPVCGCGYCVVPLEGCPMRMRRRPSMRPLRWRWRVRAPTTRAARCNGSGGVCFGPYCDFCRGHGGDCAVDGQCCSGLCDQGACVNCKQPGGTCDAPGDCCSFICRADSVWPRRKLIRNRQLAPCATTRSLTGSFACSAAKHSVLIRSGDRSAARFANGAVGLRN